MNLEQAIKNMVVVYRAHTGAGNDEMVNASRNRFEVRQELARELSRSLDAPVSVPRITIDGEDITIVIHQIGPIENHIP